jgi:uncharacterized FlaG/YvyC family protein
MGVNSIPGQGATLQSALEPVAARTPLPDERGGEKKDKVKETKTQPPAKQDTRPTQDTGFVVEATGPSKSTKYHIDESSQRIVAQILNENREVIRQLPPEELLQIAARFREIQGILFDKSV